MSKLNVPYRSQWDADAGDHSTDCGPTCLAMMLNYLQISITPDAVYNYAHLRSKGEHDYTTFTDLARVARANDLKTSYSYPNQPVLRGAAFKNLFANIDAGKPMLVLVSYAPWRQITGNQFGGAHFVVVSGYDDANIYIHDPLFGTWVARARGAYYAMSHDLFAAGWGGCSATGNTDWSWLTIETKGAAPTPPPPAPVVAPPKAEPETETAVSTPITGDIERRIRSLAAYRWTEPPNFNNAAEVKQWQDRLGDFASQYETYAVQPGNTLSGLASKFYGAQNRWPVIKTFNKLEREGLWAGEKLKIPNLGQSGAGSDSTLPQNTIDKAKAFDPFTDIVDPDSPAQDYTALVGNTAGLTDYKED